MELCRIMFYSSIETQETIIFSPLNLMHSFRKEGGEINILFKEYSC